MAALQAGRLLDATTLRLPGVGLKEWPDAIFDLADTLEVLDLGHNALTRLPHDLGRLKRLRVLFASGNPFERLPPVLGDCPLLSQIGFRGCGMREIPAEALPPQLRWLTLTDNALESLPEALAERPALQKLMLAGNRLRTLPESLAAAPNLELLRLSANRFEALPPWLASMPRLAWLAWSGQPARRRVRGAGLGRDPVGRSSARSPARRGGLGAHPRRRMESRTGRSRAGRGEAVQGRDDQRRPAGMRDGGVPGGGRAMTTSQAPSGGLSAIPMAPRRW